LAEAVERQKPSKGAQVLGMAAAIATVLGVVAIVDMILRWIRGG
jgi:hypothetical protein